MASKIKFIWIGKIKKKFCQEAVDHYWQRLNKYYALEEVCLKPTATSSSCLQIERETEKIRKKLTSKDYTICLDRQGQKLTSPMLANKLNSWFNTPLTKPCFIIGGAYGLDKRFKEDCSYLLSFGPMTFPHELSRIMLLEQIYRATTINFNHPYHH